MEAITDVLVDGIVQILVILIAIAVSGVTGWIKAKRDEALAKGKKAEVELIEKVAYNAVEYAEQTLNDKGGFVKMYNAMGAIIDELGQRGVHITEEQARMFLESAVHAMNENNQLIKDSTNVNIKEGQGVEVSKKEDGIVKW